MWEIYIFIQVYLFFRFSQFSFEWDFQQQPMYRYSQYSVDDFSLDIGEIK